MPAPSLPTPLAMSYDLCESYDMKEEPIIVRSDEARRRLRELLNEIGAGRVVEIRRYDTPEAVMVSPQWFARAAALMETNE